MTPITKKAEYLCQDIPEFKNNPFIEALDRMKLRKAACLWMAFGRRLDIRILK